MRVGSTTIMRAFVERKPKKLKNDYSDGEGLYYHNNLIACWTPEGNLSWTLCGWNTVTTRQRINALFNQLNLPFSLCQNKREPYLYFHGREGEMRAISAQETYTVEAFDIAAMRHLKR
jgi:hypothetical protein